MLLSWRFCRQFESLAVARALQRFHLEDRDWRQLSNNNEVSYMKKWSEYTGSAIETCSSRQTRNLITNLVFCIVLILGFTNLLNAAESSEGLTAPYDKPYIDVDEWRDTPVRHRYVHGGFTDTELRFSLYFPPKEQYDGRFFQPLQAVSGNENTAPMALYQASGVGFALDSGAYLVESNQGSRNMFGGDSNANAAVAIYSRTIAVEMYGEHRPYGYVYGGSGGAFKTLGSVENHPGVWDGSIPFVHGSPVAIPYVFTVQAHAMRVLKDKFPQIVDAIEPGGSGDMYAGLSDEEKEALEEVTYMGFPPRAWFNVEKIAFGYTGVFTTLVDSLRLGDPTYFQDFWSKPGYLGANPTESLKKARIQQDAKISALVMPDEIRKLGLPLSMPASQVNSGVEFPAAFRIANLPKGDLQGATITMKSGEAQGSVLYIVGVVDDLVMIGFGVGSFQAMAKIREGDEIAIDNSVYLAAQTYHRHQVQAPEFYIWNLFKDKDGEPKYPQRPRPLPSMQSGGSTMSGNFNGKMIVISALMDEAAFPWQADWYRSRVKIALGDEFDDRYRLYYIDNSMHTTQLAKSGDPRPVATTRVISYQGALQQALRDLSNWVENDVAPPMGTQYQVDGGQIVIPDNADERKGIQPVVTLKVNGSELAKVKVGETVKFSAEIEAPPQTGQIVKAEWDFDGAGEYPRNENLTGKAKNKITVTSSFSFSEPGTYFPAIRVASNKDGDANDEYASVQNIGRVRVIVE